MTWLVLFSLMSSPVYAGGAVGNGGDAVVCSPSNQNQFAGYYSLDYLVKYQPTSQPRTVKSLDESLDRIENNLKAKLPELTKSFQEYRRDLFNENDSTRKHLWRASTFGLIDLKDESLVEELPENCKHGGKVYVVQAVVRQPPIVAGLPEYKIKYKFVPKVVDELKNQNAVQLSFLIVHEWLWDFSKNVERNREINYWLHSKKLENWTRADWLANLAGIGFTLPGQKIPIWEESVCQPDLNSLNAMKNNDRSFEMGQGQLYQRVTNCMKSPCDFHEDSVQFRKLFSGPVTLSFNSHGWVKVKTPKSNDVEISCIYDEETGRANECRYYDLTEHGDMHFELRLYPVFGADCVTLRGTDLSYDSTDEYVLYFSNVKFSKE